MGLCNNFSGSVRFSSKGRLGRVLLEVDNSVPSAKLQIWVAFEGHNFAYHIRIVLARLFMD